jgi:hypothetical protein
MPVTTEDLDELLLRDEQLKALALPVVLLFGLTLAALIGILGHKTPLTITGWMGTWLLGPWVLSRAAPLLGTPVAVKYPLFISCALPLLSLAAPLYVWQASRSARAGLETDIRQAQLRERRRDNHAAPAPASAAAAAAPAATAAPVQEALPVLRGVAAFGAAEGEELKLQISGGLPPGATATPDMLPPARATAGVFAVGYHVDAGSHWTSVSRDEMRKAGLDLNALHRQATSNLMRLAKGQPGLRHVPGPTCTGLLLDGDHEACLVLLDGLWDHLFADQTPNGAVVAIPARDVLAFCDANSAEGIETLRESCRLIKPDAKGALFQGLLLRRNGRWSVLEKL